MFAYLGCIWPPRQDILRDPKYTLNTPCPFASGRESGRESPGAEGEGLVGGEGGDRDRGARDGGTARVRGWERG